MPIIKRAATPPPRRKSGQLKRGIWTGHATEAAEVKSTPGEWCLLVESGTRDQAARPAGAICRGDAADFKPDHEGHFEAVTRRNEKNPTKHDLWVVYIPTGPESGAAPKPKRLRRPAPTSPA